MNTQFCSKVTYRPDWNHRREPIRPIELRVLNFDMLYDWDNIWYDAVQVNPTTVLLIGPPLYNTKEFIINNSYFTCGYNIVPYHFVELDRVCITVLTVENWTNSICMVARGQPIQILVARSQTDFQDQKTIVTISRDHPIQWLLQWIDYHKIVHGITGFLIYNNNSNQYSSEELQLDIIKKIIFVKKFLLIVMIIKKFQLLFFIKKEQN